VTESGFSDSPRVNGSRLMLSLWFQTCREDTKIPRSNDEMNAGVMQQVEMDACAVLYNRYNRFKIQQGREMDDGYMSNNICRNNGTLSTCGINR